MIRPVRLSVCALLVFCIFSGILSMPGTAFAAPRQARPAYDDQDLFLRSSGIYSTDGRRYDAGLLASGKDFSPAAAKGAGKPGPKPPPPAPTYPNDPYYNSTGTWGQSYADLWGIKKIGGSLAVWDLYKGAGITIGIVDTGLLFSQQDLASNIWFNAAELNGLAGVDDDGDGYVDDVRGWDFVDGDNNPLDLNGHGSHVAGIAAGVGNNSKGIIGIAPLAKVMAVRVLDRTGSGSIQSVADGIRYAAKLGAQVINLSLGAANLDLTSFNLLQSAVDFARGLGRIIVAAAGNSNANVDTFSPANLNGVIAVGATDPNDARASFSNFGSKLFITAPGVDILSAGTKLTHIGTRVDDNDYRASGTSMAAPFVSGAIALLLNKYPGASLEFIRAQLAAGAVDLGAAGWDPYYGYGRLNIAASLGVTSTSSTAPSASVTSSGGTSAAGSTQSAALDELLDKQAAFGAQAAERADVEASGAALVGSSTYQAKDPLVVSS